MKRHPQCVMGAFARQILRADLIDGRWNVRTADRPAGTSAAEAFSAAIALTEIPAGKVWLISDEWFSQTLDMNPAQTAGLTDDQLRRALSFESEPFSGVPMTSACLGFHQAGTGAFEVIVIPLELRDRLIGIAGSGFAGIAYANPPPAEQSKAEEWCIRLLSDLEEGRRPFVGPPKPQPSPHRFRRLALGLEAAALVLLAAASWWIQRETKALKAVHGQYSSLARELNATRLQTQARAAEIETLRKESKALDYANGRRLSLPLLLQGLSVQKLDEIVVREIKTSGPSASEVHGVALTSDAVDELALVLKESLRGAGWMVCPAHKKALKRLANGGPWEFSLSFVHEESAAEGVRFETEEELR